MTSVVSRRAFASPVAVPLLVLVDMQQEYLAEPRLLALSGTDAAVGNCRKVLEPSAPEWPAGGLHAHGRRIRPLHLRHTVHSLDREVESYAKSDFRTW
jgi:hypothetical protein